MGFKWLCPCGTENQYDGNKTVTAITTCKDCRTKARIWKYRILKPQKPHETTEIPQKTTIIHRPSKVSVPIDNVNWVLILKILDRGYSTIKNKPGVKAKKGGYYFDSLTWEAEIKKIEEIAKVMKLMGDEK